MSFNPADCPTAQDHALVEFCGNCGYSPGEHEGEEFMFQVKHLAVYKDRATDVVLSYCDICGGYECPITIGDLLHIVENDHPKEKHEDPSKTPASS